MLDRLPNELLHLIVRIAVPFDALSPATVGRRQTLLVTLSQVSKRLCAVTKPLFLQTILIPTPRQANLVRKLPKKLREQVETVILHVSTTSLDHLEPFVEDYKPDLLVGSDAIDALRSLPKVKHARFYDFGQVGTGYKSWQASLDFDLGPNNPFRDLDSLFLSNCKLKFVGAGPLPIFALTRLAFVGSIAMMNSGIDKLLTTSALPNLRILRSANYVYNYAAVQSGRFDSLSIPSELLAHINAFQVRPAKMDGFSASAFNHSRILVEPSRRGWNLRQFAAIAPSVRYIRLTSAQATSLSETASIIPDLHNLEAVFIHRDAHPDKVEPKKRVYAERLLDAVKQTSAEIIWTGSDDHAFILPEFEQYIKDRK